MKEIVRKDSPSLTPALARATSEIRAIKPDATSTFVIQCVSVGLTGEQLELVAELAQNHGTSLASVLKLRKDGLSLARIALCLEARDSFFEPNASIKLVHGYLSKLGFNESDTFGSIPENLATVLSAFADVAPKVSSRYPLHRIIRVIDEVFGGRLLEAYHLLVSDEQAFVDVIKGRTDLRLAKRAARGAVLEGDNADGLDHDCLSQYLPDAGDQEIVRRLISDAGY